jgi:hypothetical protein
VVAVENGKNLTFSKKYFILSLKGVNSKQNRTPQVKIILLPI